MIALFLILALARTALAATDSVLVWQDEFDMPGQPDPSRWDWDEGGTGMGNNEAQYYTRNRPANAHVEDGELVITARREDTLACWYGPCKFTSARLVTRGRASWLYGRVDVRAKLPEGRGVWPAIWMLAETSPYGSWPASGEIDIMEFVGHDPDHVHANVHTQAYNHKIGTSTGSTSTLDDLATNWHVYNLEWGPDSLFIGVDGIRYHRFGNQGTWQTWPFDQPFHILLNLAIGGDWGGAQGVDTSKFPQEFRIDWVRVFKVDRGDGPYILVPRSRGAGRVTLQPDQHSHVALDTVTATATPEAGWEFVRWRSGAAGSLPTSSFLVDHSDTIEAVFLPAGERVENGDFDDGLAGWSSWNDDAVPTTIAARNGQACIKVSQAGSSSWMSQFDWPGLIVAEGEAWELGFSAQTDASRPLSANLVMDHAPHDVLSSSKSFTLSPGSSRHVHRFAVRSTDSTARLEFDFGTDTTSFCLDSVSLRRISGGLASEPRLPRKNGTTPPPYDASGRKLSEAGRRPFAVRMGEEGRGRIERR